MNGYAKTMTRTPRRRTLHPRRKAEIIMRQHGICGCGCGQELGAIGRLIEFDHEIPLADGGDDTIANMQALTKACHRAKTNREATERAKVKRLASGPRMNRADRMLARYLEQA